MNLKRFFQMILSVVACMLIIISILVSNLLSNQERLNEASKMQNEAANMLSFYRMVNEITVRLIRQYSVTGDEKARQEYDDVIEGVSGWDLSSDPQYVMSAWRTVLIYIMSDYKYLHE